MIGHDRIRNFFDTALAEGQLSHAYGFIGPKELGKRTLAFELAAKILKVSADKLAVNPDFILVGQIEDEKTGKLKKEITVTQARELRARLQYTSWANGYRVIIIDDADKLNAESANALLKLLEEPPEKSIFFLLIENELSLLPTVRSRLQTFYFSLVSTSKIASGLREKGVSGSEADVYARRALGRPGRAVAFKDNEFLQNYESGLKTFQELSRAPFYKKLELVENFYGDKEDGERGREAWQRILDLWVAWFRDWLLRKHGAAEFASEPGLSAGVNFSSIEIVKIIDALTRVKKLLHQNIHPRLAIEEVLLKF